jgi:RNA polymerase sigma-70 factor (ECF subfamily)
MSEALDGAADLRPLLFSIGYRMLGTVADAEDVAQEALLRYQRALADGTAVESPKAYLSAVVTRLAIDALRARRARRESYVGEWLPEPLLTDDAAPDPAAVAERADSLSMAFLLLLERLTPVERAAFLLHDVFDYPYDEVAAIVGKSEANCRQLATRARRHVREEKPRFDATRAERDRLAGTFFAAAADGDVDQLVGLLAADVVVYGDGGGKAPQWSRPIAGHQRVARLLVGMTRELARLGGRFDLVELNGQPGALALGPDDAVISALMLDITDGVVQTIRSVINPDKLGHLGRPVADAWALLAQRNHGDAAG